MIVLIAVHCWEAFYQAALSWTITRSWMSHKTIVTCADGVQEQGKIKRKRSERKKSTKICWLIVTRDGNRWWCVIVMIAWKSIIEKIVSII